MDEILSKDTKKEARDTAIVTFLIVVSEPELFIFEDDST